jgi:hypothetical protein
MIKISPISSQWHVKVQEPMVRVAPPPFFLLFTVISLDIELRNNKSLSEIIKGINKTFNLMLCITYMYKYKLYRFWPWKSRLSVSRDHGLLHFESRLSKLALLWDVTTIHRKHVNYIFFNYITIFLFYKLYDNMPKKFFIKFCMLTTSVNAQAWRHNTLLTSTIFVIFPASNDRSSKHTLFASPSSTVTP